MVCINLCGMELAVDFTVPAFFALLLLLLPQSEVTILLLSCIIHESAHFFMLALFHIKPTRLRLSGAGMQLSVPQAVLCPMGTLSAILLAGTGANFLAALLYAHFGCTDAAAANLSLGLFNLLPYRAADGGTLLGAWLEHLLLERHPHALSVLRHSIPMCSTVLLTLFLLLCGIRNPSLWGMLLFLTLNECLA